jgi:hypothetical protein
LAPSSSYLDGVVQSRDNLRHLASISFLPSPLVSRRHSISRNNLKSLRRFKRLIITYYIFR